MNVFSVVKQTTKVYVAAALFILSGTTLYAQKGNNQIAVIAEAGFPSGKNDVGFGGFIKGMYGIGKSGQVTLQTGLSKFQSNEFRYIDENGNVVDEKAIIRLIPFLVGYKHNFSNFYVEPQAGYGEFGGKMDIGGDWSRPSMGAFYWAVGAGYQFHGLDVGIRYQSAHASGKSDAGIWNDKEFSFVGVHIGYAFPLK